MKIKVILLLGNDRSQNGQSVKMAGIASDFKIVHKSANNDAFIIFSQTYIFFLKTQLSKLPSCRIVCYSLYHIFGSK